MKILVGLLAIFLSLNNLALGVVVPNQPVPKGLIVPNRPVPQGAAPIAASDSELGATKPVSPEPYPINLYKEFKVGNLGTGKPPTLKDFADPALAKMQDVLKMRGDIGRALDDVAKAAGDLATAQNAKKELDALMATRAKALVAKSAVLKDIITKAQQKNKDTLQAAADLEKFQKVAPTANDKLQAAQVVSTIKSTTQSVDNAIAQAQNTLKKTTGETAQIVPSAPAAPAVVA